MTNEETTYFLATASSRAIAAIGTGEPPLRVVEALANKLNQLAAVIRQDGDARGPSELVSKQGGN